jgi:hypothetical protein
MFVNIESMFWRIRCQSNVTKIFFSFILWSFYHMRYPSVYLHIDWTKVVCIFSILFLMHTSVVVLRIYLSTTFNKYVLKDFYWYYLRWRHWQRITKLNPFLHMLPSEYGAYFSCLLRWYFNIYAYHQRSCNGILSSLVEADHVKVFKSRKIYFYSFFSFICLKCVWLFFCLHDTNIE